MGRHHHHHHHHHHGADTGMGCLVMLVLGLIAMPIVGFFMLFSGDTESKALGLVLLIVGIIIWVAAGIS